ncbi:MAG: hypothetical protein LBS35_09615 [Synergistaceae bacterium]|nr:hypothetical protein [Synergistaceae bacterium]
MTYSQTRRGVDYGHGGNAPYNTYIDRRARKEIFRRAGLTVGGRFPIIGVVKRARYSFGKSIEEDRQKV